MPSAIQAPSSARGPAPVRVLVIGGSYGGLAAGLNLLDLCNGKPARFSSDIFTESKHRVAVQIKIVDRRDGYYHLIGSPLALASKTYAARNWTRYEDIPTLNVPGISWTQGSVVNVDCERKVATIADAETGETYDETYDYLVASSGLSRTWPSAPQSLTRKEYLCELNQHIEATTHAREGVVVIGGGAVGIEIAAELKLVEPSLKVALVHSRDKLLSSEPLPDEFKDRALSVLKDAKVEVVLNHRVVDISPVEARNGSSYKLTLGDGSQMTAGAVITALSKPVPTTSYLPDLALDLDGYVKISPSMNFAVGVPNFRRHFAIGDLAAWPGIKRCGGAMHMGHTAAINIHQQILHEQFGTTPKFLEIPEFEPMIALAVGKEAVMYGPKNGTTWGPEQMEMMFGNDLGWSICWDYLKLSDDGSKSVKAV